MTEDEFDRSFASGDPAEIAHSVVLTTTCEGPIYPGAQTEGTPVRLLLDQDR